MSCKEWQEWKIYMRRRPSLEARVDAATTLITWHIDMIRRMLGGKRPGRLKDYFPWTAREVNFESKPDTEGVESVMKMWMEHYKRQAQKAKNREEDKR